MIRHSTSFYCRRCRHTRRFTKRGLNHRHHLIATILTLGLWGFGWLHLSRRERRRMWRCQICHSRQDPSDHPDGPDAGHEHSEAVASLPIAPRRGFPKNADQIEV
jgi:hypothetical protein